MKTFVSAMAMALLTLAACNKQDACIDEQLSCVNGSSAQGQCSCSPGYEGVHCDQEKLPLSIDIKNIALQGYPAGACSDYDVEDSAPYKDADLYLALYHNNELLWHTRALAEENYAGDLLIFNLQEWRVSAPHDGYELRLYDKDEGLQAEDDLISRFYFFPYTRGKGFPEKLLLDGHHACQIGNYEYNRPYQIYLQLQYNF